MSKEVKKSFPLKYIIVWTMGYFIVSGLIFLMLFNFNILYLSNWIGLSKIVLHGFAKFSFIIALVAWIPIWLAGCITIIKTSKPLITLKKEKEEKENKTESEKINDKETKIIFPSEMPEEMHVPYTRMIRGQLSRGVMNCKIVPNKPPVNLSAECNQNIDEMSMMLPESFDIDKIEEPNIPVFKELNWDDVPNNKTEFNKPDENKIEIKTINNKKFAIITHDDSDFWVADEDNWFATGKQKPSPINAVITAAKNKNAIPVLLLKTDNIMDLEILILNWKADGIKIIKDISEL